MAQTGRRETDVVMTDFASKAEAAHALARKLEDCLRARLADATEPVTILLSGGSTPAPAYTALASADLDWSRLEIGLVDDRWVPEDHAASNARLVRESLLENGADSASFFSMTTPDITPEIAAVCVDQRYARFHAPDVVVLGMGPDGHTASWFPGSAGLTEALSADTHRTVVSIDATGCPVAGDLTDRLTVTLPVLERAKKVFLFITGEEKRGVLQDTTANLPIHRLLEARHNDIEVIWAP